MDTHGRRAKPAPAFVSVRRCCTRVGHGCGPARGSNHDARPPQGAAQAGALATARAPRSPNCVSGRRPAGVHSAVRFPATPGGASQLGGSSRSRMMSPRRFLRAAVSDSRTQLASASESAEQTASVGVVAVRSCDNVTAPLAEGLSGSEFSNPASSSFGTLPSTTGEDRALPSPSNPVSPTGAEARRRRCFRAFSLPAIPTSKRDEAARPALQHDRRLDLLHAHGHPRASLAGLRSVAGAARGRPRIRRHGGSSSTRRSRKSSLR